jgi:hypothetical protein
MADEPSLFRRIGPALLLIPLAPLIAEFLLGDFSIRMLPLLIVFAPMYGGGAVLIREITRRTGRGWPTMLLLATAYAIVEEAYTTQSLFNPNSAGARLLDHGFIPSLGILLNWTLFVLSIHVVWSVATPILIAEGIAAERRTRPWLKMPGLAITVVLFLLGGAMTTNYSLHASPFRASVAQLASAGVFVVIAIVAAFAFRPASMSVSANGETPTPWLVGGFAFIASAALVAIEARGRGGHLTATQGLVGQIVCELMAIVLISRWSRWRGWESAHYLAIALGTSLTYAAFGLYAFAVEGHTHLGTPTGPIDIAGQIVLTLVVVALIGWGMRRSQRAAGLRGALST